MKHSVFVNIAVFCLLATSCAPSIRSGCSQAVAVALTRADIPPVLGATDSLQTFDMEISFFGKRFNGMLLVKRQDSETVRILINSYFGMSMADFELRAGTFTVHYLLDAMNKPSVVALFKNDFKLLCGLYLPERFTALESVCGHSGKPVSIETVNGTFQYRINGENRNISKIKAPGVSVDVSRDTHPRTITLKHRGIFGPAIVIREME
jgi:hypothetical protein